MRLGKMLFLYLCLGVYGASVVTSSMALADTKKYTIGMSQCNLGEPWRVQMNADIKEAAAKHPEITMIWKDAQKKSETQQSQVREFIQQKVDLLIISPLE